MVLIDFGIKRRSIKLLRRINESQTTRLFILTSICQAIIVIAFEARVYFRNESTSKRIVDFGRANTGRLVNCRLDPSLLRMNNIIEENVLFIVFQVFQMWLCFNAIYNQNTIQIITIAAINFFCASFGIVQMFEVRKWYNDFGIACPTSVLKFNPNYFTHDVPLVIILMIFGSIMAFLSWKLYLQFGWNIYKKIGGDIQKQAMFKTYLIYVMLLKLGLFFILGLAAEACTVFKVNLVSTSANSIKHNRYLPRPLYLFHIGVSVLIVLNQIIGYRSVKKEMKNTMILVCVLWVVIIADFGILLYHSIGSVRDSWYFFIIFLIIGIILTFASLWFSIRVYKNFGQGLQDVINKIPSESQNGSKVPWSIED